MTGSLPAGPAEPGTPDGSTDPGGGVRGASLVRASLLGTALFVLVAGAAAVAPRALGVVAAVVDLVLFAAGCAAFVWTLLRAADRSREEELSVAGIWLLSGSAPPATRRALLGALGVEVAVALATAAARPFTALAFGILVPVYGLGLAGVWGAAFGRFGPREGAPGQRRRAAAGSPDPRRGSGDRS